MPALEYFLNNNMTLFDYEKITNEKEERLIAFGREGGIAGAIDFLAGLGHFLLTSGLSTPLLNIDYSYKYFDAEDCLTEFEKIGKWIY